MNTYKFQPQHYYDQFGTGVYSVTYLDPESHNPYPYFDDLDSAIAYMVEHEIFGCVQRYATWPAPPPGPEPDDRANFGWRSMWFSDKLDYERGFRAITAGVVWVSKGAPVSPLTAWTTLRIETEIGTLLEEIPGAFDEIMKATEVSEDEELERS